MYPETGSVKLLDEYPIIILPSLAAKYGTNEAILLQQIHYWLLKSENVFEGKKWFYMTLNDWTKQLYFMSDMTIRRTLTKLETLKLISVGNFNKKKYDKTKWYTLNYQKIHKDFNPTNETECSDCTHGIVQNEKKGEESHCSDCTYPSVQSVKSHCSDCTYPCVQPVQTYTRDYTENNINISSDNSIQKNKQNKLTDNHKIIIDYLNQKVGGRRQPTSKKTITLLNTLFRNGYSVEDIKNVIDSKCEDWLHNEYRKYLTPTTIFSNKFEKYLNEYYLKKDLKTPQSNSKKTQSFKDFAKKTYGENWRAIVDEST